MEGKASTPEPMQHGRRGQGRHISRVSPPTTWASRLGALALSGTLTFLWVWLLFFLLSDVGRHQSVRYSSFYDAGMPPELLAEVAALEEEVTSQELKAGRQEQLQQDLKRGMEQSAEVMQQMMDLQRLALEKGSTPSQAERDVLAEAQGTFIASQEQYRAANTEIQGANATLFELRQRGAELQVRVEGAEEPIRKSYEVARREGAFREASLRLLLLIPLLILSATVLWKRWRGAWRPIYMSVFLAVFWTVGLEMFQRFPAEYFKYIAILTAIGITLSFLAWVIRKATSPSPTLVLARNRAAYMGNTCPICAFQLSRTPIQAGPLAKRRSRDRREGSGPGMPDDRVDFSCPSCGTGLFESCAQCASPRHSLLPFCEGCGAEDAGALTVSVRAGGD